jgi:pilus assembly protein CpaB
MSARQLIVLAVAALAAIVALVLIRGMSSRNEPVAENAAPVGGEQVLVVTRDIPQGAALSPSDLAVAVFPASSVSPSFVSITRQPSAQADYVGAVTRRAITQGEPITLSAVIQPEGRGFMAAQLEPGFRAVAVEVTANTAVGGFIQPNDHVDVIATYRVQGGDSGGQEQVRSDIILRDVRVLAMGENTQPQTSGEAPQKLDAPFAVLELSPEQARVLAMADDMGEIDLALRGVQAETVGLNRGGDANLGQTSGGVRVHAYGAVVGGD